MSGGPDRDGRGPALGRAYAVATRVFSVTIIGFGLAMVVVTLARGGGPVALGVIFGLLFMGIGAGRLWVSLRG